MKKLLALIILVAAAGGGAYYYYNYGKPKEKPQVVETTLTQGDITEVVQATGSLEALRTVQVGSQVSGTVKDLHGVDFNSIVTKDEVIADLDPTLLQVQVQIAQANVEKQNGQIASEEVNLADARNQLARTQGLFDKQLANQQQLDAAILTVKQHETSLDSAKKQLIQNNASLDQAKLNVAYCTIRSPIDGVVVNRIVDVGQTVQASTTTPQFFVIATDLRNLKLTAGVDEADIGKIRPDMNVAFTVESYTQTFYGTVNAVRLNATTSNNVVTYPVWIDAPNPDLKLRPSMTANIRIIVSTAPGVVKIPNQATRFRPTSDMYTALGLTAPQVSGRVTTGGADTGAAGTGQGGGGGRRGGGGGGRNANAQQGSGPAAPDLTAVTGARQGAADQPAQTKGATAADQTKGGAAANQPAQTKGGQGRQGASGQTAQGQGGRGFGQGATNLTPEQRAQMAQQFAAGGGRGGRGGQGGQGGQGGRGGQGRGGRQAQAGNVGVAPVALNADKIDQLYPAMQRSAQRQNVYVWDAAANTLTQKSITVGVSDGQFSEMVAGDLKVGDKVVTSIIVPVTQAQRNQQNQSLFGGAQQGGRGGLQPGGGGPGGFGGGGGPGGGGGGGGGGGRGGGD